MDGGHSKSFQSIVLKSAIDLYVHICGHQPWGKKYQLSSREHIIEQKIVIAKIFDDKDIE